MRCEYCLAIGNEHNPRCPLYEPQKSNHYCSICKESILLNDEYIVNEDNEYAHWDCVSYRYDLANFLHCEVKTMYENEL